MANLAFRAEASGGDSSFTSATVTATVPTGTVQDDLERIYYSSAVFAPTAAPTHTTPTGWEIAGSSVDNGFAGGLLNARVSLYYRIAPTTPVNATLTSSANCAHGWTRLSHDNPDTSAPFGQVTFGTWSGTAPQASSMTTTKNNALISMAVFQGVAQACTPDGSLTERSDNTTYGIEVADAIQATAGSTGTKTASVPTSSDGPWVFDEFWSELPAEVAGASSVALTGTATTQAVVAANASATVALAGTATAQTLYLDSASGAVSMDGTATAQQTDLASAAAAVGLTSEATTQQTGASSAAAAVALGGTATDQQVSSGSATVQIALDGAASSQAALPSSADSSVALDGTATTQSTVNASAAGAVTVASAATAQQIDLASAAAAITLAGTATTQQVGAATASASIVSTAAASTQSVVSSSAAENVALGAAAAALSAGDLLGTDNADVSDAATTQAVFSAAAQAAVELAAAATTQAVLLADAADVADMGDSASASMAGGSVYNVEASDGVVLDGSATAPGIFSVQATDGIDVGDLASSASGATGDLEEKIDALTTLVQQLAQDVASAKSFYVGGPDHNDYERRELLRNYDRGVNITEQNAMLMTMFKAIVTQGSTP